MKKLLLSISIVLFLTTGYTQAQVAFEENFSYAAGALLTANGYTVSSGTTFALTVTSPGLTYLNYPSISGNALTLTTSGEDDYKSFTAITGGSVYLAFLLNVQSALTGDYFIALSPTSSQTNYYLRVHIKSSGSGYVMGLSKSNEVSGGSVYGTHVMNFNATYLVVCKHSFVAAATTDDIESIFVFTSPSLPATEPSTAEVGPYTNATKTDPTDLAFITLRQGSATSAPALIIDGIRIATNWGLAVTGTGTGVEENNSILPTKFELSQNYPNPFNPATTIKYQVPQNSFVSVNVYDVLGNEVRTLVREEKAAGSYELRFDASNMPSGVYFYKIQAGDFTQTKKMILMK